MGEAAQKRCAWVGDDPLYQAYHDREWGVPVHDDQKQFEFLVLEGAQAGLSWLTVLKRREGYRRVFHDFDVTLVSQMSDDDCERALLDEGIIRNRLKVYATVKNAKVFMALQKEFGSFDCYIWSFVGDAPIRNSWSDSRQLPATSVHSDALSKDLRKRGMSYVGSTIMYAHMQACGLVNDHEISCFRYNEV
jgi:DNA-3-methyladenine glycosylase I